MVMSSPLAGAEITTFFAPAARCLSASGRSVNRPVLSSTRSTPSAFHGSFSGSLIADTLTGLPLTTSASPCASTVPGKRRWMESYFRRCASVLVSVMSFTATKTLAHLLKYDSIRTEEHTTGLQSRQYLLSRILPEKKKLVTVKDN